MNNLKGLLETIQDDKEKFMKGLREQDQDRNYKTPEVIAILELSFALVQASIMTLMEAERANKMQKDSPMPRYHEE